LIPISCIRYYIETALFSGDAGDKIAKIIRSDSMKFWNKMKKNTKGFTLVEIIVVLVILAVLAAFTIPTMLGFVDQAKRKAAIAEQREVYIAAQAIVTERFAKDGATKAESALGMTLATGATEAVATNLGSDKVKDADETGSAPEDQMLDYLTGDLNPAATGSSSGAIWTVTVDTTGHVKKVTYTRDGITLDDLIPSGTIE
jgi:type IV pilus assembly protein PilA